MLEEGRNLTANDLNDGEAAKNTDKRPEDDGDVANWPRRPSSIAQEM